MTAPVPFDMLLWDIGRAIANAVHETPPPAPVGKIAARAVLDVIDAGGWKLTPKEKSHG